MGESPRFIRRNYSATTDRSDVSLGSQLIRKFSAQAISIEADTVRSISGRLGGRFDGLRASGVGSSFASLSFAVDPPPPTEGTCLLLPNSPMLSRKFSSLNDLQSGSAEGVATGPPSLTNWIFPALSCAAAYAFYNIFIKKGSATIHPILGGVILQFVAALLGTCLLVFLMHSGVGGGKMMNYDKDGMRWSTMAGVAVGLAEMLSFCVSGLGVPATQSIPIIIGGSVMFGAVLGMILLGEELLFHGWSGIALLVTGIVFVALDPGEKVDGSTTTSTSLSSLSEELIVVGGTGKPPVYWILIALICASAYAFYNIFIKKGSASISPILGGVVLQFVAAIFGSILLGVIILMDGGTSNLDYDSAGIFWSCMAGIAVGSAEMLSFCVSGMGVNATQSIPVIIGGSVLVGALLGLSLLGESMLWPGWVGIGLLTAGIGIVATDPGKKVEGH